MQEPKSSSLNNFASNNMHFVLENVGAKLKSNRQLIYIESNSADQHRTSNVLLLCATIISRSLEDQPNCQQCSQRNVRNQDRLVQRYMVPCPPRPSSLLTKKCVQAWGCCAMEIEDQHRLSTFPLAVVANKPSPPCIPLQAIGPCQEFINCLFVFA